MAGVLGLPGRMSFRQPENDEPFFAYVFVWVVRMSEAGATVIEDDKARRDAQEVIRMPAPASTDHDSRRFEGLAWSHELDLAQLLAAVGGAQPGEPGDEQAAAEEAAAMAAAAEAGARRGM